MNVNKSKMKKTSLLILICLMCSPVSSQAKNSLPTIQSEGMSINVEKVAQGFGVPWGMVFLSSNKLLVTDRNGPVRLYYLDQSKKLKLKKLPSVKAEGQGGMLDVAIPPDYKAGGWIYFTYVKEVNGEGATVLARGKLETDRFSHWQELLVTKSTSNKSYHFGSRISFDDKGHVFFGIGDRGKRSNAQNLKNHAGSIIRLNLDGTIPDDNPYNLKSNNKKQAALPEIWSYGHRNPQGLIYDFKNKRLWSNEHGPRGGDEINLILPGHNYGWPVISYGKEYWGPIDVGEGTHRKGMSQPVKVYTPSIAPGSLMLYTGDTYPEWKGNLFSGALKLRHINRIVLDEVGKVIKEERLLEKLNKRIRTLAQSPKGRIYFSTDDGTIYRLNVLENH